MIGLAFRADIAASIIIIGLAFRADIAAFIIIIGLIFRADIAASIIIIGLVFRADIAAFIIIIGLAFRADVAASIIIIGLAFITSTFSSNLNEWFAAHTFSITIFSVIFLRAQTFLFMFVPDKWSLADTLILLVPVSGLRTCMA